MAPHGRKRVAGRPAGAQRLNQPRHLPWLQPAALILALWPLLRLFWLGWQGALGANPVEFVEHSTGIWALVLLLVALSITPIQLLTDMTWQNQLRRTAGLLMFLYASLHFLIYLWLDHGFDWPVIVQHIARHPYLLVGFLSFVCVLPLALTSNHYARQRLGARWKTLHKLIYPAAILAVLHFWWLVKRDVREPAIYAAVLVALLAVRAYYHWRRPKS